MPRVIHFEIGADDPDRAAQFYREVFDWDIVKWEGQAEYWLATTGTPDQPGIDGAIQRRTVGAQPITNTIDVPSVDEFVAKAVAHGGSVALPKMTIPGVGYIAYCKDTEGNVFGIMQADPNAS